MSVYVGNLSYNVTEEDLAEVFADYGTVKQVTIPTDRDTGRMRGFAFVQLSSEEEEAAAITALDGTEWMDRAIKVNKAKPRERRNSFGGGGDRRNDNRFSRDY